MSQHSIDISLQQIIAKIGIGILDEPLRLAGLLRDYHPHQPAEISVLMESVRSGSVEMLLRNVPTHECAASLSAKGGIAPRYSDWAMQLWKEILPDFIREGHQNIQDDRSQRWEGSVEEVLGPFKESRRRG